MIKCWETEKDTVFIKVPTSNQNIFEWPPDDLLAYLIPTKIENCRTFYSTDSETDTSFKNDSNGEDFETIFRGLSISSEGSTICSLETFELPTINKHDTRSPGTSDNSIHGIDRESMPIESKETISSETPRDKSEELVFRRMLVLKYPSLTSKDVKGLCTSGHKFVMEYDVSNGLYWQFSALNDSALNHGSVESRETDNCELFSGRDCRKGLDSADSDHENISECLKNEEFYFCVRQLQIYCTLPLPIASPLCVSNLACGMHHFIFQCQEMSAYGLFAVGNNSFGQLGFQNQPLTSCSFSERTLMHTYTTPTFLSIEEIVSDVKEQKYEINTMEQMNILFLAAAVNHSFAIIENCSAFESRASAADSIHKMRSTFVFAWGDNSFGQLGIANKDLSNCFRKPSIVMNGVGCNGDFNDCLVSLSTASTHTLAVTKLGKVLAWGNNLNGQCGADVCTNPLVPHEIPLFLACPLIIKTTSASTWTSLFLTVCGQVLTCGSPPVLEDHPCPSNNPIFENLKNEVLEEGQCSENIFQFIGRVEPRSVMKIVDEYVGKLRNQEIEEIQIKADSAVGWQEMDRSISESSEESDVIEGTTLHSLSWLLFADVIDIHNGETCQTFLIDHLSLRFLVVMDSGISIAKPCIGSPDAKFNSEEVVSVWRLTACGRERSKSQKNSDRHKFISLNNFCLVSVS